MGVFLFLLALPAAEARPPAGRWVPLTDGTAVCVSNALDGSELKPKDRLVFDHLVDRLAAGEDPKTLVGPLAALQETRQDPAYSSLAIALSLASDTPDVAAARALADAWPEDPCLAAAAASALTDAEGRRADPEVVARYVGRAWLKVPHPELARVLAGSLLVAGEVERAQNVLGQWIPRAPEYPGLRALQAEAAMQSGDSAAGLDALMVLHRGGDHSRDAMLATALYRAGRIGEYLLVAAATNAPLAGADVTSGTDALAALRSHLGLSSPGQQLVAQIETSKGLITCVLATDTAPVTVANFWGLATGRQPWTNPVTGQPGSGSLYDGTRFHRVIPGFMLQGGDPLATGEGGPGYAFADEVTPAVTFDRRGKLAMANSGPATNGSQFFVTLDATPHLNGKHTIFGQCDSADVLARIAEVPRDGSDQPNEPVTIDHITFEVRQ